MTDDPDRDALDQSLPDAYLHPDRYQRPSVPFAQRPQAGAVTANLLTIVVGGGGYAAAHYWHVPVAAAIGVVVVVGVVTGLLWRRLGWPSPRKGLSPLLIGLFAVWWGSLENFPFSPWWLLVLDACLTIPAFFWTLAKTQPDDD